MNEQQCTYHPQTLIFISITQPHGASWNRIFPRFQRVERICWKLPLEGKRFPKFTFALRCWFFTFLSVYNLQSLFSMGAAICFTFIVLAHQSVYPMNCNLTISRSNLRASVPFAGSNIGSNLTRLAPGTPTCWSWSYLNTSPTCFR